MGLHLREATPCFSLAQGQSKVLDARRQLFGFINRDKMPAARNDPCAAATIESRSRASPLIHSHELFESAGRPLRASARIFHPCRPSARAVSPPMPPVAPNTRAVLTLLVIFSSAHCELSITDRYVHAKQDSKILRAPKNCWWKMPIPLESSGLMQNRQVAPAAHNRVPSGKPPTVSLEMVSSLPRLPERRPADAPACRHRFLKHCSDGRREGLNVLNPLSLHHR